MRKITMCLLVVVLAMGMVFAQGGNESAKATAGSGKSELRVVTFFTGSDQWAPVWKALVADYMQQHPGVTIIDESQPTSGANDLLRTKIQSDIAAKTPPDLMLFFNGADGQMAIDSDLFVDFTSFMADDKAWSSNLKPSAMAFGNIGGNQYCLPYIGYYEGLFYNKALFDKFGLQEPTSWANIIASIDVFKKNGISAFATSMAKPSYLMEQMILAQVGAEGQKDFFGDSWAPSLAAIKDLYDRGAFPPDTLSMTEDDIRVLFKDQKAAMMINGSWMVNGLKDNKDMRIITMPSLPGGKGGSDNVLSGFGSGWYMSKAAAKRDGVALDFLKYMTSPETMTRFIAIGGSPAVTCSVPEGASNLEASAVAMLNTATKAVPAADSQVVREAWLTLVEPGIQYICEGAKTPLQLLREARALNF
nr:extracellular solute-binding protein [uncultured Sphaerochaeta sp.]